MDGLHSMHTNRYIQNFGWEISWKQTAL